MKIKETTYLKKREQKVLEICKKYKISVSSIRYGIGHTEHEPTIMTSIKIGSKKVGQAYDDSYGGGSIIDNKQITELLKKIEKETPTYKFYDMEMTHTPDIIIHLLQNDYELRKSCKKNIIVFATKTLWEEEEKKGMIPVIQQFEIKFNYENTDEINNYLKEDLEKKGFVQMEIINKRYI